jgi:hypothetical protein
MGPLATHQGLGLTEIINRELAKASQLFNKRGRYFPCMNSTLRIWCLRLAGRLPEIIAAICFVVGLLACAAILRR